MKQLPVDIRGSLMLLPLYLLTSCCVRTPIKADAARHRMCQMLPADGEDRSCPLGLLESMAGGTQPGPLGQDQSIWHLRSCRQGSCRSTETRASYTILQGPMSEENVGLFVQKPRRI